MTEIRSYTLNAKSKRRLLKMAKLLREDADNKQGVKFDIGTWGHSEIRDVEMSCGTTACAMGLAAVSGAFAREGLTARIKKEHVFDCETADMETRYAIIPRFAKEGKRAKFEIDAACGLFEIEWDCAINLFTDAYMAADGRGLRKGAAGERRVARRIEHLVATGTIDLDSRSR